MSYIYKEVVKCLVNRFRPLLDEIISPSQSIFVPGRTIIDNALLSPKCIYHIQQEKNLERSFCAHKLDLSKAYDQVDSIYLKQMMQKVGFACGWVDWIMTWVTSVRYSDKFNGTLLDSFAPMRVLWQGDHLPLFLFLLVVDGLSAL